MSLLPTSSIRDAPLISSLLQAPPYQQILCVLLGPATYLALVFSLRSPFALEPIRFVSQFEWREMTEMERCAIGTYWKRLGDALVIRYDALPSGKTGFQDGIHWLEEIGVWSEQYEVQRMQPHPRNKEIAEKTIDVLVYNVPNFLKPLGGYFVSYLMGDRLRTAMMYVS